MSCLSNYCTRSGVAKCICIMNLTSMGRCWKQSCSLTLILVNFCKRNMGFENLSSPKILKFYEFFEN